MRDEISPPGAWVAHLNWLEVEQRIHSGALGVLPVGAQAKEHGHHLPMNTDWIQAEWFAQKMCERYNILVWPTLNYGYYPAFRDFPGSCTIAEDTFEQLIWNIAEELRNHGVKQLVILNTGISTIPALQRVSSKLSGTALINVYAGANLKRSNEAIAQQQRGGHADEMETSIMLWINSKSVDMTKAVPCENDSFGPGPLVRADPNHPNYTSSGVFGDPSLASLEKGRRFTSAILLDIGVVMQRLTQHDHGQELD